MSIAADKEDRTLSCAPQAIDTAQPPTTSQASIARSGKIPLTIHPEDANKMLCRRSYHSALSPDLTPITASPATASVYSTSRRERPLSTDTSLPMCSPFNPHASFELEGNEFLRLCNAANEIHRLSSPLLTPTLPVISSGRSLGDEIGMLYMNSNCSTSARPPSMRPDSPTFDFASMAVDAATEKHCRLDVESLVQATHRRQKEARQRSLQSRTQQQYQQKQSALGLAERLNRAWSNNNQSRGPARESVMSTLSIPIMLDLGTSLPSTPRERITFDDRTTPDLTPSSTKSDEDEDDDGQVETIDTLPVSPELKQTEFTTPTKNLTASSSSLTTFNYFIADDSQALRKPNGKPPPRMDFSRLAYGPLPELDEPVTLRAVSRRSTELSSVASIELSDRQQRRLDSSSSSLVSSSSTGDSFEAIPSFLQTPRSASVKPLQAAVHPREAQRASGIKKTLANLKLRSSHAVPAKPASPRSAGEAAAQAAAATKRLYGMI
ncbi:hypothetical protein PYCC9005_001236 [Savitreella phatthalungensis]